MGSDIVVDLTRLCIGPAWRAPRGIDRVDLAYAHHFLRSHTAAATILTPWGAQYISRTNALRLIEAVEAKWCETVVRTEHEAHAEVMASLMAAHAPAISITPKQRDVRISAAVANIVSNLGIPVGSPAIRRVPQNAIYINTGQLGIADSKLLSWLNFRRDIKPIFMLHDTIPLDFPEFVPPASKRYHRKMVINTANYASGLIVTTAAAGRDISAALKTEGCSSLPTVAEALPPSSIFSQARGWAPPAIDTSYFVVCGSIEPRKNHMLLLNVWRELQRELGAATPKLVIVGSRWSKASDALHFIQKCDALRPYITLVHRLSTAGLAKLLRGASALLMPSFAEGFGLPIVEAQAVGTPVIASDIAAHREVGGGGTTYLSPLDGIGWKDAIHRHQVSPAIAGHKATGAAVRTWDRYFARVETFIASLDQALDLPSAAE